MKLPDPNGWKELVEDKNKIQEAILYLLTRRSPLSQYQIVKALWLADSSHIAEYGRPVTFDNYVAMEQGPVPSLAYDALKPDFDFERAFGVVRPWTFKTNARGVHYFRKRREPKLEYLSETDRDALSYGLRLVEKLSPKQLENLVHKHPAWVEAWDHRGVADREPMKLSLIIGEGGDERARTLAYLSEDA